MKTCLASLALFAALLCNADDAISIKRTPTATNWLSFRYSHQVGTNRVVAMQKGYARLIRQSFIPAAIAPAPEFGGTSFHLGGVTCVPFPEWKQYTNSHPVMLLKKSVVFCR